MLRLRARHVLPRDAACSASRTSRSTSCSRCSASGSRSLWELNPWLIPFALAPLVLIHRSLSVPALQAEARNDPKTGLYNARHFAATLHEELARATRFERPMSLIMADLDLLRDINNTYGHLAGDAVLAGVAKVFREQLRDYDVPARFGGEEFSILLPETRAAGGARDRRAHPACRRRARVRGGHVQRADPRDGLARRRVVPARRRSDANELVHQADLAVYRAKIQGRNRVLDASDEPVLAQAVNRAPRLAAVPPPDAAAAGAAGAVGGGRAGCLHRERRTSRPHARVGPRFFSMPARLTILVAVIGTAGIAIGVFAGLTAPAPTSPRCSRSSPSSAPPRRSRSRSSARARSR